ncbi:hypothetical protein EV130_110167 [Rhizobium azibense]|uniref:Uncharacterized protein n=1 Tax=Rhizobium azibense TaxID=1136135 RepID=A0A4R3QIY0_9HYPH|nr:hypothetical protein [Rhizobium azibense]TCU21823.1 hypothetical protein EV130_110167 [Rhizobium azibense]
MAIAETKLAIEAGVAGISLVSQLMSLIKQARASDQTDPQMAEILAQLPAAAFSLAKDLLGECEALKQAFIDAKIDTKYTIAELEDKHWWWFGGKYKLVQRFLSCSNALSDIAGHAIDDFIAVARCRDQIKLVTEAFIEARKSKEEVEAVINRETPVGEILDKLIGLSRQLRDDVQKLL